MRWYWMHHHEAKSHAVSDALYHPLASELERRGHRVTRMKATSLIAFDFGGSTLVGAPSVTIPVDGLSVRMWCDEVFGVAHRLRVRDGNVRAFRGGLTYYKLHGDDRCIVLTPSQRDLMLAMVEAYADKAQQEHEAFLKIFRDRNPRSPR